MSLTNAHLDAFLAAGLTAEQIVALVRADIQEREKVAEKRRASDRDRQRRHRESHNVTVTNAESQEHDVTPSPKVSPQTPNQNNPNPTPPYIPPPSQKRGTRLPTDFDAPAEWISWAVSKREWTRSEAEDEAECFVRFWQAKPGRDACKLDWFKTWQNWVVNSRRKKRDVDDGRSMMC